MKSILIAIMALGFIAIAFPSDVAVSVMAQEEEVGDRPGFGIQEREQERAHEDGGADSLLNPSLANIVLLGTVAAIVGVGGYAGYKIYKIRKKASQTKKPST